jgi:hypothetical protein
MRACLQAFDESLPAGLQASSHLQAFDESLPAGSTPGTGAEKPMKR